MFEKFVVLLTISCFFAAGGFTQPTGFFAPMEKDPIESEESPAFGESLDLGENLPEITPYVLPQEKKQRKTWFGLPLPWRSQAEDQEVAPRAGSTLDRRDTLMRRVRESGPQDTPTVQKRSLWLRPFSAERFSFPPFYRSSSNGKSQLAEEPLGEMEFEDSTTTFPLSGPVTSMDQAIEGESVESIPIIPGEQYMEQKKQSNQLIPSQQMATNLEPYHVIQPSRMTRTGTRPSGQLVSSGTSTSTYQQRKKEIQTLTIPSRDRRSQTGNIGMYGDPAELGLESQTTRQMPGRGLRSTTLRSQQGLTSQNVGNVGRTPSEAPVVQSQGNQITSPSTLKNDRFRVPGDYSQPNMGGYSYRFNGPRRYSIGQQEYGNEPSYQGLPYYRR